MRPGLVYKVINMYIFIFCKIHLYPWL